MTEKHEVDSMRIFLFIFLTLTFTEDRRNSAEERRLIQQLSKDECDDEYLMQQMSMLQLKLDETRKNIQTERE